MRIALIIVAALAASGCARGGATARDSAEGALLDCRPDPANLDPDLAGLNLTITVERKGGDLVWRDSNGVEQRITARESYLWRCAPHREI